VRQLSGVRKRKDENALEAGAAVVDDSPPVLLAPHQVSLSLRRLHEVILLLPILGTYAFVVPFRSESVSVPPAQALSVITVNLFLAWG